MIWPFKAKLKDPPALGRGLLSGQDSEQVRQALTLCDTVLRSYAEVLTKGRQVLLPESALSHRKSIIRDCLRLDALQHSGDAQYVELLKVNLLALSAFRPDRELEGVLWIDRPGDIDTLSQATPEGTDKLAQALKESRAELTALEVWWEQAVEEPIAAARPGRTPR